MQNILDYFNTFLDIIFDGGLTLSSPSGMLLTIYNYASSSSSIEDFILKVLGNLSIIFNLIVWIWFAWLTIHLLIIWPFNWLRSVIKRCKG